MLSSPSCKRTQDILLVSRCMIWLRIVVENSFNRFVNCIQKPEYSSLSELRYRALRHQQLAKFVRSVVKTDDDMAAQDCEI